jgi:hypothetical protein
MMTYDVMSRSIFSFSVVPKFAYMLLPLGRVCRWIAADDCSWMGFPMLFRGDGGLSDAVMLFGGDGR